MIVSAMLPSSGLIQAKCFLFEERLCNRPHCVFTHEAEGQKNRCETSTSDRPTPQQQLTDTEEVEEECIQELERINREIESVKHQVEVEQRRLSNYQVTKTPFNYNHNPKVIGENVVKDSISSHTFPLKKYNLPKKYTVDCSKPRTDLEYDPLSNFSSDLRSYCSTSKGAHKKKTGNGSETDLLNKAENLSEMKLSNSPNVSLEHPDLNKEDRLIIDLKLSKNDETKPIVDCQPKKIVSESAITNENDSNKMKKNCVNFTFSQCSSTNNNLLSNENIFVNTTEQLSNCNEMNTLQSNNIQNEKFDKSSSATALPVNKTLTTQIQNPNDSGHNVTPADLRQVGPQQQGFVDTLCKPQDVLSAAKWTQNALLQSTVVNEKLCGKEADAPEADSSSDEMNLSDMEWSESDPDEECYRIFMEANGKEKSNDTDVVSNAETEKKYLQPQVFSGKKRVAHECNIVKATAKARRQPQIILPLCASVSTISSPPPTPLHKMGQRTLIPAASMKTGQALTIRESENKNLQTTIWSIPSQPATVIELGSNLHLVLPEGTFPVSDTSGQVSTILTPITTVNTNPFTVRQTCYQSTATQQKLITQPVLIPALARKPVSGSAAPSANQGSGAQGSAAKPVGNKRKLKQKSESVKVPHDIRQSYVNKFTEEFLKTTPNVNEAFEKALAEERTVFNRSVTKLKYLSVAVNSLKKLKNQSCDSLKGKHKTRLQTKGNIPLNQSLLHIEGALLLFECLKDYILTDEMLIENNFPFQNPEKPGSAITFANKKTISDPFRKLCCRCGATYSVSQSGKHTRKEECIYHYGRGVESKVPGGVETRYSCCEGVMGSPGCQVFKLHVCNSLNMDGFLATAKRDPSDTNCPGVYSLDCEKCYTIDGLELSRVTVVNSDLQIVYDTFVRPNNEVIDYNTRFSGISEADIKGHCHSLKEVQQNLLSFISADTILIGHGLDINLCVLKLLHGTVVDTSKVFPHRLGPPHKLSLQSLTAEYLRKIIQESVCGHDTAEDAVACMELMLWKVKEDGKLKKAQ